MTTKKLLSILLIATMVLAIFAGCGAPSNSTPPADTSASASDTGSSSTSTPATDSGKFIVGCDDQFPPMGFRDENNNVVGFDIELATEVAKRMGKEVVIQPIDWSTKELELESGRIDVIWNGLTITPKRLDDMLISRPYLKNNQVIVVTAKGTIAAKADLNGKNIGVQTGSSAEIALAADELSKQVKAVQYADNVAALQDLKIGRTEAVILDEVVARYYESKEPDVYKVLDDSLAAEEYGIAFKKGNTELHDQVMKAFDEIIADGTAKAISEKWFGKDIILK